MSDLEKIKQLEQKIISLEKELKDFKEFIDVDINHSIKYLNSLAQIACKCNKKKWS